MAPSTLRLSLLGSVALALAATPADAADYFERVATWPVFLNLPADADPASETVAEIVAATPDGMMLVYTDSPGERIGLVDLTDPAAPAPAGTVDLGGEPTAVTVVGSTVLAGVNTSESYSDPSGHIAAIDVATGSMLRCDVGGQRGGLDPPTLLAHPPHQKESTMGRHTRILVNVHPRLRGELFRSDNHSFNPSPRMNNLYSSHS